MRKSAQLARIVGLSLVFLVVGLAAYAAVVPSFFVSDDFVLLQRVQAAPFRVWGNVSGYTFFPMMFLVLLGEGQLFGLAAPGYHLVSIILHVASSLCVCLVVLLLGRAGGSRSTGMKAVALLAGLWFLVSPSHSEAVSWIAARTHVLATLFGLLSLASYIAHRLYGRRLLFLLSLACFAAALLSKESVITLPFMALLFDLLLDGRPGSRGQRRVQSLSRFLAFCAVALLYLALRQWYLGGLTAGLAASGAEPASVAVLLGNLARQMLRALLPPMSGQVVVFCVCVIALVLAIAAARVVMARRGDAGAGEWQLLLFLGLSYLVATLPYLPFHVAITDTQGERYLYWPGAFLIMAMVVFLRNLLGNGRSLRVSLAAVIVASAIVLFRHNQNWSEAAGITENVVSDVCALGGTDMIVIANVADNVRGAFVLHNGLWYALQLFCPETARGRDVAVLSTHAVAGAADAVTVHRVNTAMLEVRVPGPFIQRPAVSGRPARVLAVTDVTERSYRLSVNDETDRPLIVFYSAGRMQRAP